MFEFFILKVIFVDHQKLIFLAFCLKLLKTFEMKKKSFNFKIKKIGTFKMSSCNYFYGKTV